MGVHQKHNNKYKWSELWEISTKIYTVYKEDYKQKKTKILIIKLNKMHTEVAVVK